MTARNGHLEAKERLAHNFDCLRELYSCSRIRQSFHNILPKLSHLPIGRTRDAAASSPAAGSTPALVCYAGRDLLQDAALNVEGHIAVPLGFLDVGGENPLCVPSRLRRLDASRAKYECRDQRGGETTNHVKLLIVVFLHGLAVSNQNWATNGGISNIDWCWV
jgi:hypothetical protein